MGFRQAPLGIAEALLLGCKIEGSYSRSASSRSQPPIHVPTPNTEELIKQPYTRPISPEQLTAEVKGIYAGLVMVEKKCIEIDNAQSQQNDPIKELNHDQWQALVALHRTLLQEHHDFLLASQHHSASPALRRSASENAVPARIWRHGIHSFLGLLRHRLPASAEHMLMFIYLAYSMMTVLYVTVPAFEDIWAECLGHLARYRRLMAIQEVNISDAEHWVNVGYYWYSKASHKAFTAGRLYHHLAVIAHPNALQQLYYYTKSLCVAIPFASTRNNIMTLFDPIFNKQQAVLPIKLVFTKTHGIMFSGKQQENLKSSRDDFLLALDSYIARMERRWLEIGYFTALSNCCAVVGYGDVTNPIFQQLCSEDPQDPGESTKKQLQDAIALFVQTYDIVVHRLSDPNVLPYLNTTLVFVYHLTFYPGAISYIAPQFAWKRTADMLNNLATSCTDFTYIEGESIPQCGQPLPEDFAMRGLRWCDKVYPSNWFDNVWMDDDEKYFETSDRAENRHNRVLWLGCRLAAMGGKYLQYSSETHDFSVAPEYDTPTVDTLEMRELPDAPDTTTADTLEMGELPDAPEYDTPTVDSLERASCRML
ncbi:hypothetical protein QBC43DRAFT_213752 [Cladorrhinum sp. PSN259]|nr:hypothetical protein QBC43DRAFT_213752 [Cladorrhinum sp. PSN259]